MDIKFDPGCDFEVYVVEYYQYEDSSETIALFDDPKEAYDTFLHYVSLGWQPRMRQMYLRSFHFCSDKFFKEKENDL